MGEPAGNADRAGHARSAGYADAATRAERGGPVEPAGRAIVTTDLAATTGFVVAAALGIADPDGLAVGTAIVSVVMFVAGCITFLWAFAIAVGRSRMEAVSLGGVYFLTGAPAAARRPLLGALAVQVVVALVAGIVRIYTPVAFVALAPMLGLGLAGLWGAKHAVFPPRTVR